MTKLILTFILLLGHSLIWGQAYTQDDYRLYNDKIKLVGGNNAKAKSMGELTSFFGRTFIGTNYLAHSLEDAKKEVLTINFRGLDCTTFLETAFTMARCAKKNEINFNDYMNELQKMRYRGGVLNGYTSRLHYFSDWIFDNCKKNIILDVTKELGGVSIKFNVFFMSQNPKSYIQLKENPKFVETIIKQEKDINSRDYYFIPKESVSKIEDKIQEGDLIAITTNTDGLDIAHIGIATREKDSKVHFMHAPNIGQKVQVAKESLSEMLNGIKHFTGIIVLRGKE